MNRGIPIIKEFEGCKLRAYLCPANVWTIGWGNTTYPNGRRVKEGDIINQQFADNMLATTVARFEAEVLRMVRPGLNANQIGALTSFAFNLGSQALRGSTLLALINANANDPAIRNQFMRWNRAGGRVLRGLTRRRKAEADLYFTAV